MPVGGAACWAGAAAVLPSRQSGQSQLNHLGMVKFPASRPIRILRGVVSFCNMPAHPVRENAPKCGSGVAFRLPKGRDAPSSYLRRPRLQPDRGIFATLGNFLTTVIVRHK